METRLQIQEIHERQTRPSSQTSSASSSSVGRQSSVASLRDTFFGPRRSDPLVSSTHEEFQIQVIDERGGLDGTFTDLILAPSTPCDSVSYVVIGTGVVIVLLTVVLALLTDVLSGYDIDPGLVFGSFQTLSLCTIVFVTYHGVQPFQAHPNPLILYKCVIDMLLSLRFLLDPLMRQWHMYTTDHLSCRYLSGVTQFLYFASDSWYFALIVDLFIALKNPFTSVKANRKLYNVTVYAVALLSGVITAAVDQLHGFADGSYCWTRRGKTNNFWKLNLSTWIMFYIWMIVFYVSGIAVLIIGFKRLRSGLRDTLKTRREMLRNGAISIMSYTVYWTLVFVWYAVSFHARTDYENQKLAKLKPSPVFRMFTYLLAGRGAVDYFVWFMINPPSLMQKHWLQFSSESADTKFSAQLNAALQRELIYFTIEGMTKAIQVADQELVRKRNQSPTAQSTDSRTTVVSIVESASASSSSSNSSTSATNHITFTPYKSEAFAELRSAFGIQTQSFLQSFAKSTKPSISEGASGAFMFFSGDKKYIVKSMHETECRLLCEMADDYVEHFITHPWSRITKFYGCFKITLYEKKFYFVVMENLFDVMEDGVTIHHRFDIKGSWVSRSYKRPRRGAKVKCRHCSMQFKYGLSKKAALQCPNVVGPHEPNVVLKDNDLRTRMRIGADAGRELFEILRDDSLFLCGLGIMDYSLLLGVVDIEFVVDDHQLALAPADSSPSVRSLALEDLSKRAAGGELKLKDQPSMRKSERIFGPGYYYVGIIDILQQWNWSKRLERFYKVYIKQNDPDGLSAIDPIRYQRRFEQKLREVISLPRDEGVPKPKRFQTTTTTIPEEEEEEAEDEKPPVDVMSRSSSLVSLSPDDDNDHDLDLLSSSRNPRQILMEVSQQKSFQSV